MNYSHIKSLSDPQLKRLVGIKTPTFLEMLEVLNINQNVHHRGRPSKLNVEDQRLMTLSYWREYRTLFHTAMTYGIHEASASRIITKIENILITSKKFHLPKKLPQD